MTFLLIWLPLSAVGGVRAAYAISHRFLPSGLPRKAVILASTVLLTALAFIGGVGVAGWLAYSYAQQPFSSQQWATQPASRYTIVQDLINSGSLRGLTKLQSLPLLGKPDTGADTDAWTYELGQEPSFLGSSPAVLTLYFENGRIYRHELIRP